jgi:hypothetical protein
MSIKQCERIGWPTILGPGAVVVAFMALSLLRDGHRYGALRRRHGV